MLDPQMTLDIPDMTVGKEVFSDGCGLMARNFAIQVAKKKGIKFRSKRYTPTVFQIRCSTLHPPIRAGLIAWFKGILGIRVS